MEIELSVEALRQAEILRSSYGNKVAERYLSFLYSSDYLNRPCDLLGAGVEFVERNLNSFFPFRSHVSRDLKIKTAKALEVHSCGQKMEARCLFYELRQQGYRWKRSLKEWRK